jgi:hypothetical protein
MTSVVKKSGIKDRARISLSEDHEVRFWTGKFGVAREELDEALQIVGNSAQAVADFLRKRL